MSYNITCTISFEISYEVIMESFKGMNLQHHKWLARQGVQSGNTQACFTFKSHTPGPSCFCHTIDISLNCMICSMLVDAPLQSVNHFRGTSGSTTGHAFAKIVIAHNNVTSLAFEYTLWASRNPWMQYENLLINATKTKLLYIMCSKWRNIHQHYLTSLVLGDKPSIRCALYHMIWKTLAAISHDLAHAEHDSCLRTLDSCSATWVN